MSVLFIDAHLRAQLRLAVLPEEGRMRIHVKEGRANPVVEAARFFRATDRAQATGVCVVQGPGPFSVIRSGVLFANVLARLLRVPLMGISAEEASDMDALRARLAARTIAPVAFVAPVYDAEPNIG